MAVKIYEWEEMKDLPLEKLNALLKDLETQDELSEQEIEFLEELEALLENEYWLCQSCNNYFHQDARNLRYDPSTCPECIEEDVSVFGISYDKADIETRKWMKDIIQRERQIDNGFGYYGLQ